MANAGNAIVGTIIYLLSPAEGRFSFQSGVEILVVFFVRRKPIVKPTLFDPKRLQSWNTDRLEISQGLRDVSGHLKSDARFFSDHGI